MENQAFVVLWHDSECYHLGDNETITLFSVFQVITSDCKDYVRHPRRANRSYKLLLFIFYLVWWWSSETWTTKRPTCCKINQQENNQATKVRLRQNRVQLMIVRDQRLHILIKGKHQQVGTMVILVVGGQMLELTSTDKKVQAKTESS